MIPSVVFVFLAIGVSGALPLDGVLWTQDPAAIGNLATRSIDDRIADATTGHPLLIIVIDEFKLSTFSLYANAYAHKKTIVDKPLINVLRNSAGYTSVDVAQLSLPSDATIVDGGHGFEGRVIVHRTDSLQHLDEQLSTLLSTFHTKPYTCLITSSLATPQLAEAPSIAKRQAALQLAADVVTTTAFPKNQNNCGLHINQTRIKIRGMKSLSAELCLGVDANEYHTKCDDVKATFTMTFTDGADCSSGESPKAGQIAVSKIVATISFTKSMGSYWAIDTVSAVIDATPADEVPKSSDDNNDYSFAHLHAQIEMSTLYAYGLKCGRTPSLTADVEKGEGTVSLQFRQFVAQPFGFDTNEEQFSGLNDTSTFDDCVPIMSTGSWMSILIGLLFVGAFILSVGMLNTLTVMDRYDDPRTTKHLAVNVKGE